jgi:hypothetical protein
MSANNENNNPVPDNAKPGRPEVNKQGSDQLTKEDSKAIDNEEAEKEGFEHDLDTKFPLSGGETDDDL